MKLCISFSSAQCLFQISYLYLSLYEIVLSFLPLNSKINGQFVLNCVHNIFSLPLQPSFSLHIFLYFPSHSCWLSMPELLEVKVENGLNCVLCCLFSETLFWLLWYDFYLSSFSLPDCFVARIVGIFIGGPHHYTSFFHLFIPEFFQNPPSLVSILVISTQILAFIFFDFCYLFHTEPVLLQLYLSQARAEMLSVLQQHTFF